MIPFWKEALVLNDSTPGFGILMVLGTLALAFGAAVWWIVRALRRDPRPWRPIIYTGATWAGLYLVLLAATGFTSEERVLGLDEDKKFCGFYLDCHAQIAVAGVERLDSIGARRPDGVFVLVTLRVSSDARAVPMRLIDPHLLVRDARGRAFPRSPAGEEALAQLRGEQPPLTDPVGPGGAYTTTVVFDLPRDVSSPRLDVTQGFWAERLIEKFLIGDEDSLWHKRTTLSLTA